MTSFAIDANLRAAADPAMDNCSGPILYDASSVQELLIQYNPNQAATTYGGLGPSCYNGIQDLRFVVQGDLSSRIRFDKSYLKIEYMAADVSVPSPYAAVNYNNVSIPWNPIAAIIQTIYYQLNGTNQTVERYDANFQHGNMIKLLTSYTRQGLEDNSDRFFTPCIESTRDVTTGLSVESTNRSRYQFRLDSGGGINYGSKAIMLSDIFDSMVPETSNYINMMQLLITIKAPDQILFHTTATTGINNFYVTGIKLFIVQDKLSTLQLEEESKKVAGNLPITRVAYRRFDTFNDIHSSTKAYLTTGIKNLQAAILMFPSTTSGDTVGINPYQYTYGSSPTPDTGITYYRQRYGAIVYPISGQMVDPINKNKNTELYENWKTLTRMINNKIYSPTIPFLPCVGLHGATYDVSNYVFFSSVFCNQDAAFMKNASGSDHEIVTNGGTSGAIGVIVRIRMNAYAVDGDTTVSVMD